MVTIEVSEVDVVQPEGKRPCLTVLSQYFRQLLILKTVCFCPQWFANPLNDMYADVVTTVVLEVQSNPNAQKCE